MCPRVWYRIQNLMKPFQSLKSLYPNVNAIKSPTFVLDLLLWQLLTLYDGFAITIWKNQITSGIQASNGMTNEDFFVPHVLVLKALVFC